mgnify:CR=1 FL=1
MKLCELCIWLYGFRVKTPGVGEYCSGSKLGSDLTSDDKRGLARVTDDARALVCEPENVPVNKL